MKPTIISAKGVYASAGRNMGAAGWGCIITPPGGQWSAQGGSIDRKVRGSAEAEIVAIHHAIYAALGKRLIGQDSLVELHTDCREVVAILLFAIPGTICAGEIVMEAAKGIRRDIRDTQALADLRDIVKDYRLDVTFVIERPDSIVLAAARKGMDSSMVRA